MSVRIAPSGVELHPESIASFTDAFKAAGNDTAEQNRIIFEACQWAGLAGQVELQQIGAFKLSYGELREKLAGIGIRLESSDASLPALKAAVIDDDGAPLATPTKSGRELELEQENAALRAAAASRDAGGGQQ